MAENPAAGWYEDPMDPKLARYWEGDQWSETTRPRDGMRPSHVSQTHAVEARSIEGAKETNARAAIFSAVGAAGVLAGTLLFPWAVVTAPFVGRAEIKATDRGFGDWIFFVALAAVTSWLAWVAWNGARKLSKVGIGIAVTALVTAALLIFEIVDTGRLFDEVSEGSEGLVATGYGTGFFIVGIGVVLSLIGAYFAYVRGADPQGRVVVPVAAASSASASHLNDELARLFDLHRLGALSDAEYEAAKRRVIGG